MSLVRPAGRISQPAQLRESGDVRLPPTGCGGSWLRGGSRGRLVRGPRASTGAFAAPGPALGQLSNSYKILEFVFPAWREAGKCQRFPHQMTEPRTTKPRIASAPFP